MQCDTVLALEDDWGASSGMILSSLKELLLQKGYDCIICPSPLSPKRKIDHILIPALSLAVCTSSWLIPVHCATERRIHARRFRLTDEFSSYKTASSIQPQSDGRATGRRGPFASGGQLFAQ